MTANEEGGENAAMRAASVDWQEKCDAVTEAMRSHTRPFVAPLSTESDCEVRHLGTGSFVRVNGRTCLLTCEHVSSESPTNFSFCSSDNVYTVGRKFFEEKTLDVALAPIGDALWSACAHTAVPIPVERFAAAHQPSRSEELFFFHGFAGENSRYAFGTLESAATGYVTQQSANSAASERIFELHWEPQGISFIESTSAEVRGAVRYENAGGFSGSLVWNTRFLEVSASGEVWSPECAVVSGLLQRWDTGTKTLLVMKVEHLLQWLNKVAPR